MVRIVRVAILRVALLRVVTVAVSMEAALRMEMSIGRKGIGVLAKRILLIMSLVTVVVR